MPWRLNITPYKVWISELILQQTQVKTVIPYFTRFTKKYKSLETFSKLSERQILKLWEGLGYYRRARNLLTTSKLLVRNYNSRLPDNLKEIKKIFSKITKLDILVNNAGTNRPEYFTKIKRKDMSEVVDLNIKASFDIAQLATKNYAKIKK